MTLLILAAVILLIVVIAFAMTTSRRHMSTFVSNNVPLPPLSELTNGIINSWTATGNYDVYKDAQSYILMRIGQYYDINNFNNIKNGIKPQGLGRTELQQMLSHRSELQQRLNQAISLAEPVIQSMIDLKAASVNNARAQTAAVKAKIDASFANIGASIAKQSQGKF